MDHEKWLQQHDEMLADHDRWMAQSQEAAARHDREMAEIRAGQAKTENVLRRAIRLSVQEARSQRKRHQELEILMNKRHQELEILMSKRHQELEILMKAFLERGGNGKH